jgi:hypothetical protein
MDKAAVYVIIGLLALIYSELHSITKELKSIRERMDKK